MKILVGEDFDKSFEKEYVKYEHRFTTNVTNIEKKNSWNYSLVEIFNNEIKIGEYVRNYPSAKNTFCPFFQDGEWYALYSKNYTATRVMKLPSCEDLCGEEGHYNGFCPMEYYVPYNDLNVQYQPSLVGAFGFVGGCYWGDDSCTKIQYLDLSRIKDGILIRDNRFGYVEIPNNLSLDKCVSFYVEENYCNIHIVSLIRYDTKCSDLLKPYDPSIKIDYYNSPYPKNKNFISLYERGIQDFENGKFPLDDSPDYLYGYNFRNNASLR